MPYLSLKDCWLVMKIVVPLTLIGGTIGFIIDHYGYNDRPIWFLIGYLSNMALYRKLGDKDAERK